MAAPDPMPLLTAPVDGQLMPAPPREPAPADGSTKLPTAPSLTHVFAGLRRRWLLALSLAILCSGAAVLLAWFLLPVNVTVSSMLHVALREPRILDPMGASSQEFPLYRKTQSGMVTSRLVLNAALKKDDVAALGVLPRGGEQQIDYLLGALKVDFKAGPELMTIAITGDKPDELVKLIDAITQAYLREVVDKERAAKVKRLNQLEKIQQNYEDTLKARRETVRQLTLALGSGDPGVLTLKQRYTQEALGFTQRELLTVQSDLRRAKLELETREAKSEPAATPAYSLDWEVDRVVDRDPEVEPLLKQKAEAAGKISALLARSAQGTSNPLYPQFKAALAGIEKALEEKRAALRPKAREELKARQPAERLVTMLSPKERIDYLKKMEKELQASIDELQKQAKETNVGQADITTYQQEIAQVEKVAERVAGEAATLKLEVNAPSRVELLEPASVSRNVAARWRTRMTAVAGAVGLCLALGFVAFRELRSGRFESSQQLTQSLGVHVVGTIPSPKPRARGGMPWTKVRPYPQVNLLTEHVDAARISLLNAARAQDVRVILVTSACGGEGKTSVACHLALSLSRAGFRTLLIDGDLRRPAVHRVLDLPESGGLSEVLRNEIKPTAAIKGTRFPQLSYLGAGKWNAQATEALARSNFRSLLRTLRAGIDCAEVGTEYLDGFDYIVLDSAPLLPIVDTLLMAQHVDGILLSVLQPVSQSSRVQSALQRLRSVKARVLGAVMSGVTVDAEGIGEG